MGQRLLKRAQSFHSYVFLYEVDGRLHLRLRCGHPLNVFVGRKETLPRLLGPGNLADGFLQRLDCLDCLLRALRELLLLGLLHVRRERRWDRLADDRD